jgi:hypothetical protein
MAPPQSIQVLHLLPWPRSMVTEFALHELENGGQLGPNVDGQPPVWIVLPAADREPNPPFGYVVSFVCHHERGFAVPVSRLMHGLCYHYGVELHNFAPNAISQAATFVGVCEGFVGIPRNWDLLVNLFRAELHTPSTPEPRVRRAVHAGGMSISLRESHKELYIPCTMTSNNAEWAGVVLPSQRRARPPPYTGKVLREKADSWWHSLDEDITSMDMHEASPLDIQPIQGPITRARARQLSLVVSSFLSVPINNFKNDSQARISLLGEVGRATPVDNLRRRGAAIAGFLNVLFRSRIDLCRDFTKSSYIGTFQKIGNPSSHHLVIKAWFTVRFTLTLLFVFVL